MSFYYFKYHLKDILGRSPLKGLYYLQACVYNCAFISSFLYHARETVLTRNADYYLAFASILIGLLVAINRLIYMYKPMAYKKISILSLKIGIYYFIIHVVKMSEEFDYFYNKIACGIMFVGSCACNITIYYNLRQHKGTINLIYSMCLLLLAGFVEILDFSPIFYILDSHAIWHALMAFSIPFYFKFIKCDVRIQ